MRGSGLSPPPDRSNRGITGSASLSLRDDRLLEATALLRLVRAVIGYVAPMNPVSEHPEGATLRVHVVPGASRTEIKGVYGDAIRVRVQAPPEGGKANRALVDLVETTTGGRASIFSGASSRTKVLLIRGVDADSVRRSFR